MSTQLRPEQLGNLLLDRLQPEDYLSISQHVEVIQLSLREAIFKRERDFRFVYFPISCVVSVIAPLRQGVSVEIAAIGNEGFASCDALIGGSTAHENYICQAPGLTARMRVTAFQEAVDGDTPLRRITQQYMRAYIRQVAQTAACNRAHSTEERFARWVLMMRDRVGKEQFPLNDEFIGYMLGESRSVVNLVTQTFINAGLFECNEDYVRLLNIPAIQKITCECYQTMTNLHSKLLGVTRG